MDLGMYLSSSLPQFPFIYVTSNAFIARGICATQAVDRKMLIGVACGRGRRLATKLQDRHAVEENECGIIFQFNTDLLAGFRDRTDRIPTRERAM
jgi:hypothetical protein